MNDAQFKTLIESMTSVSDRLTPTRNFLPGDYWASNGYPNGTADQGQRYFLSTVLAVVGDEGRSTLNSALQQIDRSCSADGTNPEASVYFANNNDVGRGRESLCLKLLQRNSGLLDTTLSSVKQSLFGTRRWLVQRSVSLESNLKNREVSFAKGHFVTT